MSGAANDPAAIATAYPGGPPKYCFDHPEEAICDLVPGTYHYVPSMGANVFFAAFFAASFLAFAATWAVTRRGAAFNIALMLGLACEVLGYAGRIMGIQNKWDSNGFLMQICCLTIGPAFMAASVYLCLRRIVSAYGERNSRLPATWYTRIFIPCDVVSLILQATGGAIASIGSGANDADGVGVTVDQGTHIMVAGLVFQVATVTGFIVASIDFGLRCRRRYSSLGPAAFDQSPTMHAMRSSRRFQGFLGALALSALCILIRSAFRVAELSKGWDGPVMKREDLFIGFEGVLILVAVLALNVFHPAFCGRALLEGGGGLGGCCGRDGKKKADKDAADRFRDNDTSDYSVLKNAVV